LWRHGVQRYSGPEPWEAGPKDTVIALPQEITRVKATFDLAGRYVWHCHILEHKDNEMICVFSPNRSRRAPLGLKPHRCLEDRKDSLSNSPDLAVR
jgi:Multicopper oxidase